VIDFGAKISSPQERDSGDLQSQAKNPERAFSAPAVGRKMNPSTESPYLCVICGKPCSLEECLTDEKGRIVHKECYQTLLLRALNFDKLPGISTTRQKPFNIDKPSTVHYGKLLFMKKEPSPKWILAVRCPTCGAAPGEKCELSTGQPRTEPHRERRLIASDGVIHQERP